MGKEKSVWYRNTCQKVQRDELKSFQVNAAAQPGMTDVTAVGDGATAACGFQQQKLLSLHAPRATSLPVAAPPVVQQPIANCTVCKPWLNYYAVATRLSHDEP